MTDQAQWNPLTPGTCIKQVIGLKMSYTHSAIIAFSDFFFAILPSFVVDPTLLLFIVRSSPDSRFGISKWIALPRYPFAA